ncbi:helix-turn-helix transcriptional regulator [Micromonospora sp. NPDC049114]|uniref:helix-turn-helix domain-containing protein n=1 Tax=unclassified Micromonospora TaxID=2617518 RepID=UPI0033D44454
MATQGHAHCRRGGVTGYLLKLIRESIPATQEHLAVELGVERATVQSWESGRRPFTSVAFGQAIAIRQKLTTLGANAVLLDALDDAAEADFILAAVLDTHAERSDVNQQPLGWSVLTQRLTDLVLWAVIGQPPPFLRDLALRGCRRGPVAAGPLIPVEERAAFFTHLRVLAERAVSRRDPNVVLHRQACFLAGTDPTGTSAAWLTQHNAKNSRPPTRFHTWTPLWPDARSLATSLANQGDPEPLRHFIARAHPDDACERAALNYSAYWVGEIPYRQRDDSFMPTALSDWRGFRLLRHLVERLDGSRAFVDLNIHNTWALLTARRQLALDHPAVGRSLIERSAALLDGRSISEQSRRELTSIVYSLRTDGLTGTGTGR